MSVKDLWGDCEKLMVTEGISEGPEEVRDVVEKPKKGISGD